MRFYRIEMTELAEEDLENIGDYIAFELKAPLAALDTVNGIREKADSLQQYPERHQLDEDEELAKLGIRRIFYRNYKIYYIVQQDTVKVVRILHMLIDSRSRLYKDFALE